MPDIVTRSQYEATPHKDRAALVRGKEMSDGQQKPVTPDPVRLVFDDGVGRKVFTREAWDALPVEDKGRMGARLRVERIETPSEPDKFSALGDALAAKLASEAA